MKVLNDKNMSKSFKDRVLKFWSEFEERESGIRKMIDDKIDAEVLIKSVDDILSIAFTKAFFELGVNDEGKYELILTPEGDRAKLFQLEYWLKQAPEVLSKKWNFYSSKPAKAKGDFAISMYNTTLSSEDVVLYYKIDVEHQKLLLRVDSPSLMRLDQNQKYSIFFVYLDQLIGESYTMEYVGSIDFVSPGKAKGFEKIDAMGLKGLMDRIIVENDWFKVEDILERTAGYEMTPSKAKDWQLREDVYVGFSSCFPVLNAFFHKSSELFAGFNSDGIISGFLFFENINLPKDRIIPLRAEIEEQIITLAKAENVADLIGGATGFYFSYIDFIIYDIDAFLVIAQEVLTKYKFKQVGFSNFIYGVEPKMF